MREGLSPRGRGKQRRRRRGRGGGGSIPAWAGETEARMARMRTGGVYPRVGGGNRALLAHPAEKAGLSPRGRGKRPVGIARIALQGSIPAWAGETRFALRRARR